MRDGALGVRYDVSMVSGARRFDIEDVRVRAERALAPSHHAVKGIALGAGETLFEVRLRARRDNVQLTEGMSPRLHDAMRRVLARLGVERPFELYAGTHGSVPNAQMLWSDPILIRVLDGMGNELSDTELDYVLGHEVGHALAYGPGGPAGAHRIACELTADRVGLIACGDLSAALRTEMRSALGIRSGIELRTDEYLAQAHDAVVEMLAARTKLDGTHPPHYLRAWAIAEFAASDTFARIVGIDGGEPIDALEKTLERLLQVRERPVAARLGLSASMGDNPQLVPGRLRRPEYTSSLEETAAAVLLDSGARSVRRGLHHVGTFATALAPPFRRLGARAVAAWRARGR